MMSPFCRLFFANKNNDKNSTHSKHMPVVKNLANIKKLLKLDFGTHSTTYISYQYTVGLENYAVLKLCDLFSI